MILTLNFIGTSYGTASNLNDLHDDDADAFSQESSDSDKQSSDKLSSLSETDDDDLSRLINSRASGTALVDVLAKEVRILSICQSDLSCPYL